MICVICDRCKADITGEKTTGKVVRMMRNMETGETVEISEAVEKHYCAKCMEELDGFLNGNDLKKKRNTDSAAKYAGVKPKTKQKKIDYGKIMALHTAGWDTMKIADEMGMSRQAISAAIRKCEAEVAASHTEGGDNHV